MIYKGKSGWYKRWTSSLKSAHENKITIDFMQTEPNEAKINKVYNPLYVHKGFQKCQKNVPAWISFSPQKIVRNFSLIHFHTDYLDIYRIFFLVDYSYLSRRKEK